MSAPDEQATRAPSAAPSTNKTLALVAMIFAVAMTFIDQTIVSIAIPQLQGDLSLSAAGVQWIVTGYLVALAALFTFGGRISDIAGHKRMVLVGIVIFAFASAMCGATPTGSIAESWLIFWRVAQGAGAAIMFPAALAIVVAAYPRNERGRAMAMFFGIAGGLTALGPLVGGFLIQISWRTIFWINVPVAVVAVVLTFMARPDNVQRPAPLDIRGTVLAAAGIGLTVLGLQQASDWGWTSGATIGSIVVGLILILVFAVVELRTEFPVMQVRIFENGAFTTDATILFLISIAFVPMFLFASMYSQISLAFDASQAGLYIGIFFLGFVTTAQIGGRILDRRGAKRSVVVGCALATVGFVLWGNSMPDIASGSDWGQWWRLVLAGAGTGLVLGPASTDALNRAPHTSYGEITGITQTVRNLGASLGVAVLGTILINQNRTNLRAEFAQLGAPPSVADKVANSLSGQGGGPPPGAPGGAHAQAFVDAVQKAFAESSQTIFYGMAIAMAVAGVVAILWLPRGKPEETVVIE